MSAPRQCNSTPLGRHSSAVGFNYEFNALNPSGKPSELAEAFEKIFKVPEKIPLMMILRNFFPILNIIVSAPDMLHPSRVREMLTRSQKDERVRQVEQAKATMNRIGTQLIAEKKAAIAREASEKKSHGGGGQSLQGRDLLTLLIKANMATDIPDSQRLSDADVLSRTSSIYYANLLSEY